MVDTNAVGITFNTDDVIKAMAEKSKTEGMRISQQEAHNAINLLKMVTADALGRGAKVQLTGFASFSPSYRTPRTGYNVVTNEPMDIPGCIVVTAKAGKSLKDAVRDLDEELVESIKESKVS